MQIIPNRRSFLTGLSAIGAAGVLGDPLAYAAEGELETTSVVFANAPGLCLAPQYVAEELIRAEGLTDFRYGEPSAPGIPTTAKLSNGEIDFSLDFQTAFIIPIDAGAPIKVLTGVHIGCYELLAREGIRSILDLKGKTVGIGQYGSDPHIFISVMATFVGLDLTTDIHWLTSDIDAVQLFADGKIDAFMSFPPEAQKLRAEKVGNVVVNSMLDRPWSQYFCCMLASNATYAEKYPVATKRVVRAILKAADLCVSDPESAARILVDRGYADEYSYALQSVREMRYKEWREYDPEDTIRFFSLRLHEAGMLKSDPQKIIANGTDWRFLNELKLELKA